MGKSDRNKGISHFAVDLLKSYQTLNKLWHRGLLPNDLKLHYFLHWFAFYNGNILRTGRELHIHRNTIEGHFKQFGFSGKVYNLLHSWQRLAEKNKKASFPAVFFKFYRRYGKPKFTPEENRRLTALWQIRFPFKALRTHYALWGIRAAQPMEWVQKKLGHSQRNHLRLLAPLRNSKTGYGFWLSPLKPRFEETTLSRRKHRA